MATNLPEIDTAFVAFLNFPRFPGKQLSNYKLLLLRRWQSKARLKTIPLMLCYTICKRLNARLLTLIFCFCSTLIPRSPAIQDQTPQPLRELASTAAQIDSSQVEGGRGNSLSLWCRVTGLQCIKCEGLQDSFTPVAKLIVNAENCVGLAWFVAKTHTTSLQHTLPTVVSHVSWQY